MTILTECKCGNLFRITRGQDPPKIGGKPVCEACVRDAYDDHPHGPGRQDPKYQDNTAVP